MMGQCLIVSCTGGSQEKNKQYDIASNNSESQTELTTIQKSAFSAFDSIQLKIKGHHLYSTFPGSQHECFPADTSYVISKAELLEAMKELLGRYETGYTIERYNELSSIAVMVKDEYRVEQCYLTSMKMVDGVLTSVPSKSPLEGIWIIPKVLGHRDIVLKW